MNAYERIFLITTRRGGMLEASHNSWKLMQSSESYTVFSCGESTFANEYDSYPQSRISRGDAHEDTVQTSMS